MRRRHYSFLLSVLLWGCSRTPFLIADFDSNYKPKLKTVALMPFSLPVRNQLAENHRSGLEEKITGAIVESDSSHSYLFPYTVRLRLWGAADSAILRIPADSAGKLFSAQVLLYSEVIRLYQSEGSNPTTREVGASKFQRRGVELLVEFRLVETASGKLLWRYRVRRFGEDVETASQRVGQAAAGALPL